MDTTGVAILSRDKKFVCFAYEKHRIRFVAPKALERYLEVLGWEDGRVLVRAKYAGMEEPVKESIDMALHLGDLGFEVGEFLRPIKEVRLET